MFNTKVYSVGHIYETTNLKFNPNNVKNNLFVGKWVKLPQEETILFGTQYIPDIYDENTITINFSKTFKEPPQMMVQKMGNFGQGEHVNFEVISSYNNRCVIRLNDYHRDLHVSLTFYWCAIGYLQNRTTNKWERIL